MNPAAIPGMRQLSQIYNWFSGSSPAIPADTVIPAGTASNAVQTRRPIPLSVSELFSVFNFLEPKDLGRLEQASKTFQDVVERQWESRCQDYFPETELGSVLPATLSYKESLHFMIKNIFDESFYKRYIGNVEPASQIAKANFLKIRNQPDPCDPAKQIGREYVLVYIPSHIEIDQRGVSLDKADDPDDPNDPQAPRPIRGAASSGAQSKSTTLKVAVTINNIAELFKCPKTGNPSTCSYIWDAILEQHGNERMPAGWICMRRDVIGRYLSFSQQQALVTEKGVVLSELLPRILFNFMEHSRSKLGAYPDGQTPWTFARTSTLTRDSGGTNWPSCCGAGGPSGLDVDGDDVIVRDYVGVAVALPAEVQALVLDHLELVSGT